MTIIYVAGPMSGIKDHNRPLFNMVSAELEDQGHSVLTRQHCQTDLARASTCRSACRWWRWLTSWSCCQAGSSQREPISNSCWPRSQARRFGRLAGAFCMKGKAMSNIAMSNETDLDWLARNVHVWREGANYVTLSGDVYFHQYRLAGVASYTKDQWLSRRAELQNKPSWDKKN